jgi:hypothetical protein
MLASALAGILCSTGASTPALSQDIVAAGPQLRSDPARRIFPALPATRSAPRNPATPAVTWPVTNCGDDGIGSLRAAVAGASSDDTIDLTQLACSVITLRTGAIEVDVDSLTFEGPGRDALTIDGAQRDRVLIHLYGGALSVNGLTIQHGRDRATGFHVAGGGCIASAGSLYLKNSTVRNCYTAGEGAYGGAVYAYSTSLTSSTMSGNIAKGVHENAGTAAFGGAVFTYVLDMTDSTVSGNSAIHFVHTGRTSYDIGGAIVAIVGGNVRNSTIDNNTSAGRGGGIAVFNPIAISNSTFSHNAALDGVGGGLFLRWPAFMQVNNSTFTANSATTGGGIWLGVTASGMRSTIVYGNTARASTGFADIHDDAGLILGGNNNLVGRSGPNVTLPPDTLHDNPRLGPLLDNGGPTRTHALQRNSPAVDRGSNDDGLAFDQRGADFARVFGPAADIGAVEQGVLPPAQVPTLSGWAAGLLAAMLGMIARWGLHAPMRRVRVRRFSRSR